MQIEDDERPLGELCGVPPIPHKQNKAGRTIIDDFIDRLKREDASKTAEAQDTARRPIAGTRYDINGYAGGPTTIRDLCFVEKRKAR